MYNISLKNLLENRSQRLEWESTPAHRELCTLKGKQDADCQNYIRVFARIDENKIMVCGTNSYKPLCRVYRNPGNSLDKSSHEDETFELDAQSTTSERVVAAAASVSEDVDIAVAAASPTESEPLSLPLKSSTGEFELIEEFDGQGRSPYDRNHNSSYIFTGKLKKKSIQIFDNNQFYK